MKYTLILPNTFFSYVGQLYEKVLESKREYDYVISIQRGGALMSLIMSDLLSIPIGVITLTSYIKGKKVSEPIITQDISIDVSGKRILLIDEISDTGATLKKVVSHLSTQKPKKIDTASIFLKSHSTYKPTYYLVLEDRWIVFPYELRETLNSPLMSNPKQAQEIGAYFKSCGYSQQQIESVINETSNQN